MNYNLDNNEKFYEAIFKANYLECRDMILNQNDLVNKEISKKYPLILACEKNNFKIIELLIKVNAYKKYKFYNYIINSFQ